jgi:CBS domain-containing protein
MSAGLEIVAVSNFMTHNVKTISQVQSLKEAAKTMYENDIGSIVVVTNDRSAKPAEVITERDILKVVAYDQLCQPTTTTTVATASHELPSPSLLDVTVINFMSKPVTTISSSASLWDAIQLMHHNSVRRVPVVDHEKLVGIITEKDVIKAIANNSSLICELQERLPSLSTMSGSMFERIREVAFFGGFLPIG